MNKQAKLFAATAFAVATLSFVFGCTKGQTTAPVAAAAAAKPVVVDQGSNAIERQVFIIQPILPNSMVYEGGGTAFLVTTDSGNEIVVTNKHVCEAGQQYFEEAGQPEGAQYFLLRQRELRYIGKIVAKAENTDLCLVQVSKDLKNEVQGLSLAAREAASGERVIVQGHPLLRPLTMATGLFLNYIAEPLNKEGTLWFRMGRLDFMVHPGNSGSPAMNEKGQVIGVIFAMEGQTRNGLLIPLADLRKFLSEFAEAQ